MLRTISKLKGGKKRHNATKYDKKRHNEWKYWKNEFFGKHDSNGDDPMKINFENKNLRIVLMAILLVVSCFMAYYFQRILGLGSIFSHFFYIPIIIASIWWKRMGLLVAAFLAAVLIFGHFILREVVLTEQADYIRAVLFIVIAFVVAWFSEQIEKGKVKIEHLNAVLRAIRNVNQLITT